MSSEATSEHPSLLRRAASVLSGGLRDVRALPVWSAEVRQESQVTRAGGHPIHRSHVPHLVAAVDWLCRAQDATGSAGIARGFSLAWNPYFRSRGWQPAYPETTGYIIPTLFHAARRLGRPDLADRARRAARWEIQEQLPSGAVQGGVVGQTRSPAVFNTGQVILGWLSAWEETGEATFAEAALRAGHYLAPILRDSDAAAAGLTRFARTDATLYNTRTAWALAEAGVRFGEERFVEAAARYLATAAERQHANGWIPACCLYDPERPLLHTLAYAIRGLLEGGRVLESSHLLERAEIGARALIGAVQPGGRTAGRFDSEWSPAVTWSCLTGQAQTVCIWLRLHEITGDPTWLEPTEEVLCHLKATQNLSSSDPGLRGGIKGADPVGGDYGRYEVLSWATKFFADALMRHEVAISGRDSIFRRVPALA